MTTKSSTYLRYSSEVWNHGFPTTVIQSDETYRNTLQIKVNRNCGILHILKTCILSKSDLRMTTKSSTYLGYSSDVWNHGFPTTVIQSDETYPNTLQIKVNRNCGTLHILKTCVLSKSHITMTTISSILTILLRCLKPWFSNHSDSGWRDVSIYFADKGERKLWNTTRSENLRLVKVELAPIFSASHSNLYKVYCGQSPVCSLPFDGWLRWIREVQKTIIILCPYYIDDGSQSVTLTKLTGCLSLIWTLNISDRFLASILLQVLVSSDVSVLRMISAWRTEL